MSKGRLEAFSDGVIAIIITIMVFGLKAPEGTDPSSLKPLIPEFLSYLLSFVFLGIYWNNHHHLFQAVRSVHGRVLWANAHLLFWLSLIPFATSWMGSSHFATWPVATYGVILLLAAIAYMILTRALIGRHDDNLPLAKAVGTDTKGWISLCLYVLAIPAVFVNRWFACGIYVVVAIIWLIPDRRIERTLIDLNGSEKRPH